METLHLPARLLREGKGSLPPPLLLATLTHLPPLSKLFVRRLRLSRLGAWSQVPCWLWAHGTRSPKAVISHTAAACVHNLYGAVARVRAPELTVPRHQNPRPLGVVIHRSGPLVAADLIVKHAGGRC
jgi:hypothetical protein